LATVGNDGCSVGSMTGIIVAANATLARAKVAQISIEFMAVLVPRYIVAIE
jgi:hypothetical protein